MLVDEIYLGTYDLCDSRFQITYDAIDSVQLRFLRLLSRTATQSFAYSCENSVAWFSKKAGDYSMALQFIGRSKLLFLSIIIKTYADE